MADYSGHPDPVSLVLTDTWFRSGYKSWLSGDTPAWGSHKDFSPEGPGVYSSILEFLVDGNRYGSIGSWPTVKPRILVKPLGTFKLIGGLRFSDDEATNWLLQHGYLSDDFEVLRGF